MDTVPFFRFVTPNLAAARGAYDLLGGWLLDLGGGICLVTDDKLEVVILRDAACIDDCERRQCWDETAA